MNSKIYHFFLIVTTILFLVGFYYIYEKKEKEMMNNSDTLKKQLFYEHYFFYKDFYVFAQDKECLKALAQNNKIFNIKDYKVDLGTPKRKNYDLCVIKKYPENITCTLYLLVKPFRECPVIEKRNNKNICKVMQFLGKTIVIYY